MSCEYCRHMDEDHVIPNGFHTAHHCWKKGKYVDPLLDECEDLYLYLRPKEICDRIEKEYRNPDLLEQRLYGKKKNNTNDVLSQDWAKRKNEEDLERLIRESNGSYNNNYNTDNTSDVDDLFEVIDEVKQLIKSFIKRK